MALTNTEFYCAQIMHKQTKVFINFYFLYIEEYFYDQPDVVKDFELDSLKIKPEPPQDDATDLLD